MIPLHRRQRGEGKIGCIVSLLVLVVAVAAGIKLAPVYWTDNELKDAAKDAASRASVMEAPAIVLMLRGKAQELGIAEAITPGAIKATKTGGSTQGTCIINIKYTRKIDLYGAYVWPVEVNETVSAPFMSGL